MFTLFQYLVPTLTRAGIDGQQNLTRREVARIITFAGRIEYRVYNVSVVPGKVGNMCPIRTFGKTNAIVQPPPKTAAERLPRIKPRPQRLGASPSTHDNAAQAILYGLKGKDVRVTCNYANCARNRKYTRLSSCGIGIYTYARMPSNQELLDNAPTRLICASPH
jgi:hypothetical protein